MSELDRQRVIFAEGEEPRIIAAATQLRHEHGIECLLVGETNIIRDVAISQGLTVDGLKFVSPSDPLLLDQCAEHVQGLRQFKSISMAERLVKKPLPFAAAMVAIGEADLMVGGATSPTKRVIEAAAMCMGYAKEDGLASSYFVIEIPNRAQRMLFADCAVNVDPSAEHLASIAVTTAQQATALLAEPPRVAMLSFSTQGSASHASIDKVKHALELARAMDPSLLIDGEMQVDTALSERVAATKWQGESAVAGRANVLIFPSLEAGNIGYKLVQQFTGARAIGPMLQGFKHPVADLSRGATTDEIVEVTRLALQSSASG
ncbi:Phosphate acetyltransferase [Aequoribacter fuscus]|uniref:Phosphate acetyltransferase n=1 Tax=Aequoribacter fuscus TaxID=2518989 RepID=F3KYA1_9GAMM|nr:phosphate acyltransferase [Aequoribacter fuscus]EGG30957.1 Phosphate acetyltransferase [Aequoribacter fuscus]QHJ89317.1 phosphate acetyltransferase [Aequoribacter fuscus]